MRKPPKILCSLLILLLFSFVTTNGQPRMAAGTNSDGEITCEEYCDHILTVEIPLANLDLYSPSGSISHEFFPENLPPMFLEVDFLGTLYRFQVENFDFLNIDPNGTHNWVATINLPIDVCQYCNNSNPGSHNLNIELELTTLADVNTYVPYPACNFTGPDEIFSCLSSQITCFQGSCNNDVLTQGAGSIAILCTPDCNNSNDQSIEWQDIDNPHEFTLLQNPVFDQLEVISTQSVSDGKITIFDAAGRVVYMENNMAFSRNKIINLPSQMHSGLYYIHITSGENYSIKRFIKL